MIKDYKNVVPNVRPMVEGVVDPAKVITPRVWSLCKIWLLYIITLYELMLGFLKFVALVLAPLIRGSMFDNKKYSSIRDGLLHRFLERRSPVRWVLRWGEGDRLNIHPSSPPRTC